MKNFVKGKINKIKILGKDYIKLRISLPPGNFHCKPGQFIMLSEENSELTFPRPFSILYKEKNNLELLIKVVGKFTGKILKFKGGEIVNILGPLGNWFEEDENLALVAGGYGIAPLYFYLKKYKNKNDLFLFYGGKTKKDIVLFEELKKFSKNKSLFISTEDGSLGKEGLVTDLLLEFLKKRKIKKIYSCGPLPMFKKLKEICHKEEIDLILSMDPIMGCGYGVCLGCVIPTKNGNKCACTDGPVFNSKDILWDDL